MEGSVEGDQAQVRRMGWVWDAVYRPDGLSDEWKGTDQRLEHKCSHSLRGGLFEIQFSLAWMTGKK